MGLLIVLHITFIIVLLMKLLIVLLLVVTLRRWSLHAPHSDSESARYVAAQCDYNDVLLISCSS